MGTAINLTNGRTIDASDRHGPHDRRRGHLPGVHRRRMSARRSGASPPSTAMGPATWWSSISRRFVQLEHHFQEQHPAGGWADHRRPAVERDLGQGRQGAARLPEPVAGLPRRAAGDELEDRDHQVERRRARLRWQGHRHEVRLRDDQRGLPVRRWSPVAAVPEPSSPALVALALLGLAWGARRMRRRPLAVLPAFRPAFA